MTTRQYIGPRIIPVFADVVEWDVNSTYDPLTMVQHVGETYMSRQAVPAGAPLPDASQDQESTDYWVHMSNWNAQVESYRQEVLQYNGRISTLEDDLPIADFDSTNTVKKAIDDLQNDFNGRISTLEDDLPIAVFDSTNTVKKAIDDLSGDISQINSDITAIKADSWVTYNRIANGAVTQAKLAAGIDNVYYIDENVSGIDPTGATDSFAALQAIINALPEGATLLFKKGTYHLSDTLNLKSGCIYDFNDSVITFDSVYCLEATGTTKKNTTTATAYDKDSFFITVVDASNIEIGDLVTIRTMINLNPERSNYYKGFTSTVVRVSGNEIQLANSVPYDIAAGASVGVFNPVKLTVKNIAKCDTTQNLTITTEDIGAIHLVYGFRCEIENVNCYQNHKHFFHIDSCCATHIHNCSVIVAKLAANTSNNPNPYFIVDLNGSDNLFENCYGSSNWHMWTTGGQWSVLNSRIENCKHVSYHGGSFVDHENSIGSKITNCVGTGVILVSAGGQVNNCEVYPFYDNSNCIIIFRLWGAVYDFLDAEFNNIIIHNNENTSYSGFQCSGSNGSGGTASVFYGGNIVLNNIVCKTLGGIIASQNNARIKSVVCNNCVKLAPVYIYPLAIEDLFLNNCIIRGWNNILTSSYNDVLYVQMRLAKSTYFNNCIFDAESLEDAHGYMPYSLSGFSQAYFSNCFFKESTGTRRTVINKTSGGTFIFTGCRQNSTKNKMESNLGTGHTTLVATASNIYAEGYSSASWGEINNIKFPNV